MADILDPLPISNASNFSWESDEGALQCKVCSSPFTLVRRKHHCRRCGVVICHNCSLNKKKTSTADNAPVVRVCNPCYTNIEEEQVHPEWKGYGATDSSSPVKHPLSEKRIQIGKLHVKVIEALGLPRRDSLSSINPFVRVTIMGKWSHGQAWGPDYVSSFHTKYESRTLNPRWDEVFVFPTFVPEAEVLFQVFNYSTIRSPVELGRALIPLRSLLDQERHNKWLDLKQPGNPNSRLLAGQLHVHMQYRFSRFAEFCSHFQEEPEYVYDWPSFKAARLYSNFWVLLDDLWPYLEFIWGIVPVLNWEHPSRTIFFFVVCSAMILWIQYLPILLHLILIAYLIRNYVFLAVESFRVGAPQPATQSTDVPPDSSSQVNTGRKNSTPTSVTDASLPTPRFYALPPGLHHLTNRMTNAAVDAETNRALQSVQNNMAWWSSIFYSIEDLVLWGNIYRTSKFFIITILSLIVHLLVYNPYVWFGVVVYLFIMWTVPFGLLVTYTRGAIAGLFSLYQQQKAVIRNSVKKHKSNSRDMPQNRPQLALTSLQTSSATVTRCKSMSASFGLGLKKSEELSRKDSTAIGSFSLPNESSLVPKEKIV